MLVKAAVLAGFGYFLAAGRGAQAGPAAARGMMILLCLFPLHLFRMIGAGDIKMMACMAVFLDREEWIQVMAGALVMAGCWSFCAMWKEMVRERFQYLLFYVQRFIEPAKGQLQDRRDGFVRPSLLGPFLWAGMTLFMIREGAG